MPKRQQCQKGKKQKNCQNRQAGRRKEEKRGRRWERRRAEGSAEALVVRVAQRGHVVSEQFCSQLELGLKQGICH
jgi:ribosomal protein S25